MTEMHAPIHVTDLELMIKRVAMIRKMKTEPRGVRVEEIRKVDLESFSAFERVTHAHQSWKPHQIYVFERFLIEQTNPPKEGE